MYCRLDHNYFFDAVLHNLLEFSSSSCLGKTSFSSNRRGSWSKDTVSVQEQRRLESLILPLQLANEKWEVD
jgi:hypothetical protein